MQIASCAYLQFVQWLQHWCLCCSVLDLFPHRLLKTKSFIIVHCENIGCLHVDILVDFIWVVSHLELNAMLALCCSHHQKHVSLHRFAKCLHHQKHVSVHCFAKCWHQKHCSVHCDDTTLQNSHHYLLEKFSALLLIVKWRWNGTVCCIGYCVCLLEFFMLLAYSFRWYWLFESSYLEFHCHHQCLNQIR